MSFSPMPIKNKFLTSQQDISEPWRKWLEQLRGGLIDIPEINASSTGNEFFYSWIYAHATAVPKAMMYCWAIRQYGTTNWVEYFSSDNEIKITGLYFSTQYEIKVLAYGSSLIKSDWSEIVTQTTGPPPKPSVVTGIVITDETLYIDPTTGITLASVKIEWNNNADNELVDAYEPLWNE